MDGLNDFWPWQWWSILVALNAISFLVCLYLFWRSSQSDSLATGHYRRWMRILGLIFVSVGLYRSVFVSSYLGQLAWFDTLANSSLLIRGLAFFAELSYAGLFMLALLQVNKEVPSPANNNLSAFKSFLYTKSPLFLFGCIFVAQFFATTALITKFEVLFAVEETLWGLAFLSITPLSIALLRRVSKASRGDTSGKFRMLTAFTRMTAIWCLLYCSYSIFYHLPLEYWPHIIADLQAGNVQINTGWDAVKNAFMVVNESKNFAEWGGVGFLIWHSGYFSICIWMVLFLMNGPRTLPQTGVASTPKET